MSDEEIDQEDAQRKKHEVKRAELERKLSTFNSEPARLVYEEYALRQAHYWRLMAMFARWIVLANVVPHFTVAGVRVPNGGNHFIVGIALFLCVCASWNLYAEYLRVCSIRKTYISMFPFEFFTTKDGAGGWFNRFLWYPIGKMTTVCFAVAFVVISVVNLWLLDFPPLVFIHDLIEKIFR